MAQPPQRDPDEAVAAELAAALASDRSGPLILFLARHPSAPEADMARIHLAARKAPDPAPLPGPDGTMIAAFDAARRTGPAALARFAARYRGHPLALEAADPIWTGDSP